MQCNSLTKRHRLAELYHSHQNWLYQWLRAKLGTADSAADLAHDTWLRLYSQESLPNDALSRRYLAKVAKSLLIDRYRRYRVEQAYLLSLQDLPESVAPSAESQYLVIETLMQLDLALQRLPQAVKRAFLLHRIEGKKYKDIAATLNISVSSVEKYIARALLSCVMALDDED